MFWNILIQIIGILTDVLVILVITQFVIGLLFSFNAVSTSNTFLMAIYTSIDSLLNPILRPIRKILPNTGAIDFSPLVLIIGLTILQMILQNLASSYG